jgi:hypothetical protein
VQARLHDATQAHLVQRIALGPRDLDLEVRTAYLERLLPRGEGDDPRKQLSTAASSALATDPGFDTHLGAHMLLTIAEEAGRLVLTEPEAYSPDRMAAFTETLSRMAISALGPPDRGAARI